MTTQSDQPPRLIARQMAIGFGTISFVAIAMCGMLLGVIGDVSGLVAGMQHDESSIRLGLELATAVREQSLHIAHSLIEADGSHLEHYEKWRSQVQSRTQQLSSVVPKNEYWRIQILAEKTQRLHEHFVSTALPAAKREDPSALRKAFHQIDALSQEASEHADILARAVESQMAHAHVQATDSIRFGLIGGGFCVLLVVALAVGFTVQLRASVLKPLVVLTNAARRFGRGDFETRVGQSGRGELAALGQAFDHMAEELKKRESRLVHSERMAAIGQMAAGVAHELNNPIGIIRGYLKTMTPETDIKTLKEELVILDEEAAQCERIAKDLLTYARAEQLTLDNVAVQSLLKQTVERFLESPTAEGYTIRVEAEPKNIRADESRLRQVLLNLLSNASQASAANSPIIVRGKKEDGYYCVEVQDQGAGVDAADAERIFEPFFSRRRGGSGLGLAVVQGIVRAHGGTVSVKKAQPEGAIFVVKLPLQPPHVEE